MPVLQDSIGKRGGEIGSGLNLNTRLVPVADRVSETHTVSSDGGRTFFFLGRWNRQPPPCCPATGVPATFVAVTRLHHLLASLLLLLGTTLCIWL